VNQHNWPLPDHANKNSHRINLTRLKQMYKIYTNNMGIPKRYIYKILLIMRLTTIILIATMMQVSASGFGQTITLNTKNAPLNSIIKQITTQSGYDFFYNRELIKKSKPITIDIRNAPIETVLEKCFQDQPFTYKIENKSVLLKAKEPSFFDRIVDRFSNISVSGRVVDFNSLPLAGAGIKIKGTTGGTKTDSEGNFTLTNVEENAILLISYTGYATQEIKAKENLIVTLQLAVNELESVVINKGYYTTSNQLNTGSISTVKGEILRNQPVSDPLMALQGRVPGLYISQSSGVPGAYLKVQLRGQNSIANGNDPLYIVDGIPFESKSLTQVSGSAVSISVFTLLQNNDIESIDVLKDADATAIYGSRGANGVILITTKKGKSGKTQIDFNIYQGANTTANKLKFMNTEQYLALRAQAFKNDGISPGVTDYDVNGTWNQSRYTDWQDVMIGGTGHVTNADAAISGGNEHTQFLASTNYRRESTIFPGDYLTEKKSVRLNLNHSSEDKRFTANLNTSYLKYDSRLPVANFMQYILIAPNSPKLYNEDGSLNWENSTWNNPFGELERKSTSVSDNLLINSNLSLRIVDNLVLSSNLSYNVLHTNDKNVTPFSAYDPKATNAALRRNFTYGTNTKDNWIVEPKLTYEKTFGKHFLDFLIGTSFQQSNQDRFNQSTNGYASDALIESIAAAPTFSQSSNQTILYKYNAIFSRLGYHYKDLYAINLTARRDGSSRFGPGKQFGNFGAIGAAWIFGNEQWIKDKLPFLSYGKIRSSIGTTGNDQLTDYQFMDTYSSNAAAYLGINGLRPTQLTNPYYGWETLKKIEGSVELGFFNNRLVVNANWYRNRTGNQLVGYALPVLTGFASVQANLPAVIENRGWEFDITTKNISKNGLDWTTSFNIGFPRNELISYPNIESSSYATRYAVGYPLFVNFLYHYTGINTQGLYGFQDMNNDNQIISTQDRQPYFIGQKFFGGLSNTLIFKGFQIDLFFQFVKQTGFDFQLNSTPGWLNVNQPYSFDAYLNGQQSKTKLTTTKTEDVYTANSRFLTSDARIIDASFVRLKNIAINVNLPNKIAGQQYCKSARILLQGQNLFTLTRYKGFDPETLASSGASLVSSPPLRTIALGLQLSF
jgi:TonB-linked SusC/RagA family outer membrane protein